MQTKPDAFLIFFLLLMGVLLVSVFVLITVDAPWNSREGTLRNFGDISFFTAKKNPIPRGSRTLRASEVTRELINQKLSFSWDEPERDWHGAQILDRIPPHYTGNDQRVVTLPGGGSIKLVWASMGYNPDLEGFPTKEPFTPTKVTVRGDSWTPLDDEGFRRYQLDELEISPETNPPIAKSPPGSFSLNLCFQHEGLPYSSFQSDGLLRIMDLDTMSEVESVGGSKFVNGPDGIVRFSTAINVLHPARLVVGFDVAYEGPWEETRLPARAGSRAKLTGSEIEIEVIAIERFSWKHGESPVRRTGANQSYSTSFNLDPGKTPYTSIFFSLSRPELRRFCEVIPVHPTVSERSYVFLSGDFALAKTSTIIPPEEFDEMIFRYRPNEVRAVFELPSLTGLPEINAGVDNLFDITIPHFIATSGSDLQKVVENHAAVRFDFQGAIFPEGYFPRFYENVTARELLEEYLSHHSDGSRVRLDQKTHTLIIPKPFTWRAVWKDFRKWAGI